MGQPVHPFHNTKHIVLIQLQSLRLENENIRGVISEFVTEVADTPRTIKKGYSAIPSQQDFEIEDRVEVRQAGKPLNLLKTPSYIVYSRNNDNRPLVVPRELKQGPKLDDAGNIALKGQYDQITAQIHELKKKSPLPDPSERRN